MAVRPTKFPRIIFVPTKQVHDLVCQLSKASGQSKASIVAELMDDVAPVVQGQLDAFAKIAAKPDEARQHIQNLANESIMQIAQVGLDLDPKRKKRARRVRTP